MSISEREIRYRLKWLHGIFWLCVVLCGVLACAVVVARLPENNLLRVWFDSLHSFPVGFLFFGLLLLHSLLAVELGRLAGRLGKPGISVGIAAFICTPVLLPISYARVVWWAHQALSKHAYATKVCGELGVDALPEMKPMAQDRL